MIWKDCVKSGINMIYMAIDESLGFMRVKYVVLEFYVSLPLFVLVLVCVCVYVRTIVT